MKWISRLVNDDDWLCPEDIEELINDVPLDYILVYLNHFNAKQFKILFADNLDCTYGRDGHWTTDREGKKYFSSPSWSCELVMLVDDEDAEREGLLGSDYEDYKKLFRKGECND